MIRQQINLFIRHEKVRIPFSASVCALIVLVTVLLVGGLYAKEYFALEQSQARLAAQNQAKQQRQTEIDALRHLNDARKADPQLQSRREQLQRQLQARQRYGRMLEQLQPEQRVVFSALLQGLSSQAVAGVWLTRIAATEGGARLQLQGETNQPALIPRYLRQLGREATYGRAQFDDFQISEQAQRLRFEVKGMLRDGGQS